MKMRNDCNGERTRRMGETQSSQQKRTFYVEESEGEWEREKDKGRKERERARESEKERGNERAARLKRHKSSTL